MASFTKAIAVGNAHAFLGFIDANGFLIGGSASAPAAGAAGSGMIPLTGIKTASPTIPERETVQVTGDDDLLGEFDFASLATRSFIGEFAVMNLELEAALLGTNVETFGEIKMGGLDVDNPAELNTCLIVQSRAKKYNANNIGQKGWVGVIIPLLVAQPLGRDTFGERSPGVFRIQFTPQKAAYRPWGTTISAADLGRTGPRYLPFTSEYPITMHAHTGTGALQTFTLDYEPISAAKTVVTSNRVGQTVSSVAATAPYSVSISGTPISGANVVTLYQFDA